MVIESGETVTFEDRRFACGEERFVTLGPLKGVLVAIVTAETENHIRIISMRKADKHEQGRCPELSCRFEPVVNFIMRPCGVFAQAAGR